MSEIFWSVDSLVIKNNTVFGYGWVFHIDQEICSIGFRLSLTGIDEPSTKYIPADPGKPREDVKSAFEHHPSALNSGYVVYGAFPQDAQIYSIDLVCSLADGSDLELAVPASSVIHFTSENELGSCKSLFLQFQVFIKRGIPLLLNGQFSFLFDKVRRYLKGRPKNSLHNPADLAGLLRQGEDENLCVIVDHDLGGGANLYRERLVDSIIRDGRSVVIISYHVATLSYMLILRNSRINLRFSVQDKEFIREAVTSLSVADIIYNTAVSFANPEEISYLLISLKQATSARFQVLIHDFFLVCPSHFLIDHEGNHCHVPGINDCSGCLSKNQQGFAALFVERDIAKWRSIWGGMLSISDEIITFSRNSSGLLLKAYPQIDKAKISIVPHEVRHISDQHPTITNTGSLRIGIVGHIGFHKGSHFIKSLSQEIKRRNSDVKIVVIGAIETTCDSMVVTQTGSYQHNDLSGLIEKSGANIFLFPSICPETFSYVVEELMTMSLPVASFNLGAPAERIATYKDGLVLDSMEPAAVLDALISFHRKTYLLD